MADRLIVDLNADHTVSVLTWPEGDVLREGGPAFPLVWPLGSNALTDLRWYLEEYLPLPSGVYGEEGPRIAGQLSEWGEALFMAIFGPESPARSAYMWLRTCSSGPELVFRSQTPELLGLPWELMRDPALPTPLALSLAGLSRGLLTIPETVDAPATIGKLRALMVIARPQGKRDVSYQMIARPLIERLPAVRGSVELVVLRPPTLQALAAALAAAHERGEPYHIVHFDGHGYQSSAVPPSANPLLDPGSQSAEAGLVFEKQGGGVDLVPATKIARVLNDAEVPVVVLNACQSGAIGKDLEAAIATRLLRGGTASVVAMSYNVYAVAAAEFMAGFYERLFAGNSVSAAVTAGRTRMVLNRNRPSRVGDMPLHDWLVPVHYVRRDVRFQQAVTDRTGRLPLGEELDQMRTSERGDRSGTGLDPDGTFVGRDWLFSQLESACRLRRAVILHGTGGIGKTELAKAFGRWWRDTGGVEQPEYVFFHSFEPGAATSGLESVVNQIGGQILQSGFDRLDVTERRAIVEKALSEHRMLLIWDSFETVRSMPDHDGVTKALDEDSSAELRSFLTKLAGGKSAVLITSRSPETWLGDIHRINVAGLTAQEANQYADYLLAPYATARTRRRDPAFGNLMDWLDGHPLAMRLILPRLDTTDPSVLLNALHGEASIEASAGGNRLTSLPGSIAYSYGHLSARTRRLLPAIVLLQTVATTDVLHVFSGWDQVPSRFRDASEEDWLAALDEAAKTGLLTPAAGIPGIYRIPPSLPAYLSAQWRAEEQASYHADRDTATRAMLIACAIIGDQLCSEMETGDTSTACATVGLHLKPSTPCLTMPSSITCGRTLVFFSRH